ncbi:MAG: DUF4097 family beta strand repeat protein [Pyrinomonadaceae bacterium]|nr:DUF4097 family beta strand repeat protein [Pyrinomonadaceae bacterium]
MNFRPFETLRCWARTAAVKRLIVILAIAAVLSSATATHIFAQDRHFTKRYPARKSIRLHLINRTGTILVEAWDRPRIELDAHMEAPAAHCAPEMDNDVLTINIVRDNQRSDVGNVNFRIRVPVDSEVDLETKQGNITVRGVRGQLVRAHVSSAGDIELTGIRATAVMARNMTGDILFDGELLAEGTYELTSIQGIINLRIPSDSAFRLMATAPLTRNINLGGFARFFNAAEDKRRVVGNVGNGRATLTVTNHRGPISFMYR